MENITRNTIVSIYSTVMRNEVPEYLTDTFERVLGFAEIGTDLSTDIEEDREIWNNEATTLELAGLVEITRISDLLYPFNVEEQEYIVSYLNKLIDEGCELNLDDVIYSINMNTSWYNRAELEDEYNEAASADDVNGIDFEEWLEDRGHTYYIDKWRVLYQAV